MELILEEEVPQFINSDSELIKQILLNLIQNSQIFTTQGKIVLGVKNKSKKGYIKIFVSDSGQGIKENNLKRINKQIEEIVNFQNQRNEKVNLGQKYSGISVSDEEKEK